MCYEALTAQALRSSPLGIALFALGHCAQEGHEIFMCFVIRLIRCIACSFRGLEVRDLVGSRILNADQIERKVPILRGFEVFSRFYQFVARFLDSHRRCLLDCYNSRFPSHRWIGSVRVSWSKMILSASPNGLQIGQTYLLRANHTALLAVYTGLAEVPGTERELPRFLPVRWIRGEPPDQTWPVYLGSRALWRAINPLPFLIHQHSSQFYGG